MRSAERQIMKNTKALLVAVLVLTLALIISSCSFISGPQDETTTTTSTTNTTQTTPPDVTEASIVSITLGGAKTEFAFGERFSSSDLIVSAKLSDGSERVLGKEEYSVVSEEYDSMKVGTYQATVSVKDTDIEESYNVTVAQANKLKVLMIGNSFADDTINYAYEIARNSGIPAENILIADIYIGGCTIDRHWQNAQSNAAAYRFGLEREGWFDGSTYTNWTMEQAIKYADWDFITFQQGSASSGVQKSFANLQNLMDYVYDIATDEVSNPNANPDVKFVWHMTWAYAQDTTNSGFSAYNYDQMTMYKFIQSCIQLNVTNKDFVAIIPNGTAIQNARTSFLGDNLTRDQYDHLSLDAGRYIAAMGLVGTLTGRDMSKITWKPSDSGFDAPMTNEMILVCKESYANAMASPFKVTESQYLPEDIADIFDKSFEGTGTKDDPFLIQNADDLRKLAELTAGQNYGDKNIYYKLTNDIDLGTDSWTPICASASNGWVTPDAANSFNANFDGNGKTITFVGTYTGDTWAKGLFSAIGGYVHDLTLRGSITSEKGVIGSLAAYAKTGAKIENITSYMTITAGNNQVGGIIGYIASPNVTITNCSNYGQVTARELVGGIVGGSWQNVTYINCSNHGEVTATSQRCGGIAGEKFAIATLTNCTNDGIVKAGTTLATEDSGTANNGYVGYLVGEIK